MHRHILSLLHVDSNNNNNKKWLGRMIFNDARSECVNIHCPILIHENIKSLFFLKIYSNDKFGLHSIIKPFSLPENKWKVASWYQPNPHLLQEKSSKRYSLNECLPAAVVLNPSHRQMLQVLSFLCLWESAQRPNIQVRYRQDMRYDRGYS